MTIREIDINDFFVKYLISKGYPENSINIGTTIAHPLGLCKPDFIIVDPDSNKPLAIFELKRMRTDTSVSSAIQQLMKYAQIIENPDIPLFAVFPISIDNNSLEFEFFTIDLSSEKKDSDRIKKTDTFPSYKLLKNSQLTKELSKISTEQEQTIDNFTKVSWALAFLVFLVLVADILNIFKIDIQSLALIGVIIGLIILPYANKLKILGFEFERLTQSKKGKDEK